MATHGDTWPYVVIQRDQWLYMVMVHGDPRLYMAVPLRVYMAIHVSTWLYMEIQGCT